MVQGDPHAAVTALARRYLDASGVLMRIITVVGGQAEDIIRHLPDRNRKQLDTAVRLALQAAYGAAQGTHTKHRQGDRAHRTAAAALGALGGFWGIGTALAELPVTTAAMLRSIQEIAAAHGEDLTTEETRLACLQVLGAGGPLAEDDSADFTFLGARLTLTGPALAGIMAQVAPRFALMVGPKLLAKAVPVIGAAAGAGTNYAFAGFYQDMAHVHFGLRRLVAQGAISAPAEFRAHIAEVRRLRQA